MKKSTILHGKSFAAALLLLIIFCACYEFENVQQTGSVDPNSTFTSNISLRTTDGSGSAWYTPYFGIQLPDGWTVTDNVPFIYDEGDGTFVYSDSASAVQENLDPADPGYYWWVGKGASPVLYDYDQIYEIQPEITTDDQAGTFYLDYMAGSDAPDYGGGLNYARSNDHIVTVGLPESLTVTSQSNDGPGSLRQVLDSIDFYGTITFDLGEDNTITLEEELSLQKDVHLQGNSEDPVILSGGNSTRIFSIAPFRNPHLSDMILQSGRAESGGAVYCNSYSNPLFKRVHFSNSSAENSGGAVYAYMAQPVFDSVLFSNNVAEYGGAICCYNEAQPVLKSSTIRQNTAISNGGGIDCGWNSTVLFDSIDRSNIYMNSAMYGSDLYTSEYLNVFLDTFTVLQPTTVHADPLSYFNFNILNGKLEQVNGDLYVSPDGNDENSGLNPDEALKTINTAMLKILSGPDNVHTIYLLEGTYSFSSNGESFPIVVRDYVNLEGVAPTTTILDGEGQSGLLLFQNILNCKISHLTLTGGHNSDGGAIRCNASSPVLENLNITNNSAAQNGGGIYLYSSNPVLMGVHISNNFCLGSGGGVYINSSTPPIFSNTDRCNIFMNRASQGNDVYSNYYLDLVVDTFTLINPSEYQAYPLYNFEFDILNAKKESISEDVYVAPDGDNSNTGLTADNPLRNIGFAFSLLESDTILTQVNLLDGTYAPSLNSEIYPILLPDYVSLSGSGTANVLLDAEQTQRVLSIVDAEQVKVSNMTLTGGYHSWEEGGGISIYSSNPELQDLLITGNEADDGGGIYLYYSSPTIKNIEIHNNVSDSYGGGIYCDNQSDPFIQQVSIRENNAYYGGGLYMYYSDAALEDVEIFNNSADFRGGGFYCGYSSSPVLSLVDIHSNSAEQGGGIFFDNSNGDPVFDTVNRCNIYLNTAEQGKDLYTAYSDEAIVVDTFTVLYPKFQHAYPLSSFTFDILHGMIPQVAADLYVSPDGDDSNSGLSSDDPLKTINHALVKIVEDSLNLYTIHLLEGTYSPSTNGEVFPIMLGEYIQLDGSGVDEVILDAEQSNQVFLLQNIAEVTISNLSIKGGNSYEGGGIWCNNSNAMLDNVKIIENYSNGYGGGLYIYQNAELVLNNCHISGNSAQYDGGGIYLGYSSSLSLNNTSILENNSLYGSGGGLYLNDAAAVLQDVLIENNHAQYQGGGYAAGWYSSSEFKNVCIRDNTAQSGGGIYNWESNSILFDEQERSSIYFNDAAEGREIYSEEPLTVVVDTFTVLYPTAYFVEPLEQFTFDILCGMLEQVNGDLYVSPDGNDENSGLSTSDPLKTIDRAFMKMLADSTNPHTVFLMEGVYGPSTNGEELPIKMIDYISLGGAGQQSSILDGENSHGLITIDHSHGNTVSDMTLRFGNRSEGGAIYCSGSAPLLQNLHITKNQANSGGGLYCYNEANPEVNQVTFSKNTANEGGAIFSNYMSNPEIKNSTLKNNTANWRGGGIYCDHNSSPSTLNLNISGNSANDGAGIYCDDGTQLVLENAQINNNVASGSGGGMYCTGSAYPVLISTNINNNTAGNQGGGICCTYNSGLVFDTTERSNIFLNKADLGRDLSSENFLSVVVDTFTVMYPTKFFADPISNFEFDILHGMIEQVDADLFVSPDGDDDNSGLTEADPLKTMYHAFSKILPDSANPHTVHLLDGTYSPGSNGDYFPVTPIDYLILSGTGSSDVILDAEGLSSVVYLNNLQGTTITDLTVTGGFSNNGAGIRIYNSNVNLNDLIVINNTATSEGGGLQIWGDHSPTLENLTIQNNSSWSGGGIYIGNNASPEMHNLDISNNQAYQGGGLYFYYNNSCSLSNSTISSNSANNEGGGMAVSSGEVTLDHVLIENNSATYGGGLYEYWNAELFLSATTIKNNQASSRGGGIYFNDYNPYMFDSINRCDIYLNQAVTGSDLYSDYNQHIVLDTFTVLIPKSYQAYPLANYSFDILHGMLSQEQLEMYVSPEGDDSNSGLSVDDPLKTINFAVDRVASDSLNFYDIILSEGLFSPSSNGETFPIVLEDFIKLQGASATTTILDSESGPTVLEIPGKIGVEVTHMTLTGASDNFGGSGIYINNSHSVLNNLVITGNTAVRGGGIRSYNASLQVSNCLIEDNAASSQGGGIYCDEGSIVVEEVVLSGNSAVEGGGLYTDSSVPSLLESVIENNTSTYSGGGIYLHYSGATIENCSITNNQSSTHGGGIYTYDWGGSPVHLAGTHITYNQAGDYGGGIYANSSGEFVFDEINRCNIYLNDAATGNELYSQNELDVVVDTFTVLFPKSQHAHPLYKFDFDILHGLIPQIQADLYISPEGDDNNSGLSPDDPMQTINHAFSIIAEDSINIYTVHLLEGVYSPSTNGEQFPVFLVPHVNLEGTSPDEVVLDAEGQSTVIVAEYVNSASVTNLTITGGFSEYFGGGIDCYYSSPKLENLIVTDNEAVYGGGICCRSNSHPDISDVQIFENTANSGGAVYLSGSSHASFFSGSIHNNSASDGGGIYCFNNSDPIIEDVVITENTAVNGGGMYTGSHSNPTIINTRIEENTASNVGGGYMNNSNSNTYLEGVRLVNNIGIVKGGGIFNDGGSIVLFDAENRSTIYTNNSQEGNDLYSTNSMFVVVDTFTVLYPKNYHAAPLYYFDFDILVGLFPQVSADLYVSPEGDNENSGLSAEEPLKNIYYATSIIAEDSLNLYTIHLDAGIYSPSTNEEFFPIYIPEYIGLHGEEMFTTILDAEETAPVLTLSYNNNVEVKNLTIRGGYNPNLTGGGILMKKSSPDMQNILVENNFAKYGGGIYLEESSPNISGIVVKNNESMYSGAGICCFDHSSPTIDSSEVWLNTTTTYGGGIYCSNNSSPIITNTSIRYNQASTGAALYCGNNSNPILKAVLISENVAEHSGGGIYAPYSNLSINRSTITHNICTGKGGGGYFSNFSNVIKNTLIANNVAEEGGGLHFTNSQPVLVNLVISGNSATKYGGGLYLSVTDPIVENTTLGNNEAEIAGSGLYAYRSAIDLTNTILWNSDGDEVYFKETGSPSSITLNYCDLQGGEASIITNNNATVEWQEGNITSDPGFQGFGDHPCLLTEGSPCIDAGTPDTTGMHLGMTDILGNIRIWDGDALGDTLIDLGAYEYGASPYIIGVDQQEINKDGSLNFSFYPNPVQEVMVLTVESEVRTQITIDVVDLSGSKIQTLLNGLRVEGRVEHLFNVSGLPTGVYVVKVYSSSEMATRKLVKVE